MYEKRRVSSSRSKRTSQRVDSSTIGNVGSPRPSSRSSRPRHASPSGTSTRPRNASPSSASSRPRHAALPGAETPRGPRSGQRKSSQRAKRGYVTHVPPKTRSGESDAAYARRTARAGRTFEIERRSRMQGFAKLFAFLLIILLVGGGVGTYVYFNSSNAKLSLDDERVASVLVEPVEAGAYYVLCAAELGTAVSADDPASDAYLLVRVDEASKMLTFVGIPSNVSVKLSDGANHPLYEARGIGGESELIAAVSSFAGVDIAHYAQTNAEGIARIVEALGGVSMTLEEEIDDPNASWVYVPAGDRVLTPDGALAVLRAENLSGGEGAQAGNRATFFMQMARQALSAEGLNFASELAEFAEYIQTDWSSSDLLDLADTFRPLDEVTFYAACVPGTPGEGSFSVSSAYWQRMMEYVDQGLPPAEALVEEEIDIDRSAVDVEIRNGGGVTGMGAKMSEILTECGYVIEAVGNVDDGATYPETLVIYTDAKYEEAAEAIVMDAGIGRAINGGDFYTFETDVLVIVGQDWMPNE